MEHFVYLQITKQLANGKILYVLILGLISLYSKPTNTFGYLLTSSNHPKFIFDNFPKSLFIRLRRICTDLTDFYISSNKLIKQLFSRGYNIFSIYKIRNLVSNFNRANLIP